MKLSLVIGILHIVGITCVDVGGNSTKSVTNGTQQNFKEIHSSKDLSSSSSRRNAKRQSGRGSKSSKPKVKNYSGPNGYLQVIESEPQSYSTSYHHSSDQPTKVYSNTKRSRHGKDTSDDRQKSRNNEDYDYDDRVEHREQEPKKRRQSRSDDDDDHQSDHYNSGTKGYERSSKYNKEKNDDYKKSGEIDFDTDDYKYDDEKDRSRTSSGGGRGDSSRDRYRSSNSNRDRDYREQDYHRGDASSDNRRRSKDEEEDDVYKEIDEVDSYGQPRRSGSAGIRNRERSNRDRSRDEAERDDDNYGANSRGSSTRSKNNRKKDDEYDFEFNSSDPFGEDIYRDKDIGRSPKYISSTV